jgi:hypothetical protein
MNRSINQYGYIFETEFEDWMGNKVERDRYDYPYSYDAYVIMKEKDEYKSAIYSDRLLQWDYKKHNILCKKYFGNEGQYWNDREPEKIEAFLRDFHDDQNIKLVGIMKGCNVSNGYPYWIFMID